MDKDSKDSIATWAEELQEIGERLFSTNATRGRQIEAIAGAMRHFAKSDFAASREQAERMKCGHLKAEWKSVADKTIHGDSADVGNGFCIACEREQAIAELREALGARITNYLENGGLFNPEMMEHDKVRQLLIDCRDELNSLSQTRPEIAESSSRQAIADQAAADMRERAARAILENPLLEDGCECITCSSARRMAAVIRSLPSKPVSRKESL